MNPRALAFFILAILAAGSAFVACGGGEGEQAPTATATAAATAAPTPTAAAAATPTPTPTVAELSLNQYLVLTLRIDADFNRVNADLADTMPSLQEDPQEILQTSIELEQGFSQLAGEAAERLSEVTPPPEAEAYHTALLAFFRDFEDATHELADAIETENSSVMAAAMLDFLSVVSDLAELEEQGQSLVITALRADGDDPLNSYLISAAEARLDLATALADLGPELQDRLASGDIDGALAVLEELIGRLEEFESSWPELSPPPEAEELHQRQLEVLAGQIAGERLLLTFVQDQDEAALIAGLDLLQEFSVQGPRLTADWDELLMDALSR